MPDQSDLTELELEEFKGRVLNPEEFKNIKVIEVEKLRISTRNPMICSNLTLTKEFINNLCQLIFEKEDTLLMEGLKVLINIATNESASRDLIARIFVDDLKVSFILKSIHENIDYQFLFFRLIFLLSIESFAANFIYSDSESIEIFIADQFRQFSKEITDNSYKGKILIDILRYRYNLLRHGIGEYEKFIYEATILLSKCPMNGNFVHIIGSCFNVFIGDEVEKNKLDFDISDLIKILELMMKLYVNNENKDYLGTVLMVSLNLSAKENDRKLLRRYFLSQKHQSFIPQWKSLLVTTDTSITFLTGEFLYKLCKEKATRLIRHVGFESLAGYFYSKGMLRGNESPIEDEIIAEESTSISSDEEYFNKFPEELKENTALIPETEEEVKELEYLMKRITEYNSKSHN